MRYLLGLAAIALAGCGGEDDGFVCSIGEIRGAYLMQFAKRNGTCATPPDAVVIMNPDDDEPPTGCREISAFRVSADRCQADWSVECDDDDGTRVRMTQSVRQQDAEASKVSGVLSVTVTRASDGAAICSGAFDVTYTRQ